MTPDETGKEEGRGRLEAFWDAAAALPADERETLLRSLGLDETSREELAGLVAAAPGALAFFELLSVHVSDAWLAAAPAMADDAAQPPAADRILLANEPADGFHTRAEIGSYRIQAPVGRGGMGVVYRALDTRLQRTVALKLLRPECACTGAAPRRSARGRGTRPPEHLHRLRGR